MSCTTHIASDNHFIPITVMNRFFLKALSSICSPIKTRLQRTRLEYITKLWLVHCMIGGRSELWNNHCLIHQKLQIGWKQELRKKEKYLVCPLVSFVKVPISTEIPGSQYCCDRCGRGGAYNTYLLHCQVDKQFIHMIKRCIK